MQAGLLKVVPQAVLDLLTWQEVEKKVCGDPEITVEALKRLSECPAFTIKHTFPVSIEDEAVVLQMLDCLSPPSFPVSTLRRPGTK